MQKLVSRMAVVLLVAAGAPTLADTALESVRSQVETAEKAFAGTMADRDLEAFSAYLSEDAVFITGPMVLRGREQIRAAWAPYFTGPGAPFDWEPRMVEVLESGNLALSTGPVRTVDGTMVSTFTSIWRHEEPGVWRVVFDQGNRACPPDAEVQARDPE